ncbi:MAG: glycosyltransferase [Anaerolineae bacterium]
MGVHEPSASLKAYERGRALGEDMLEVLSAARLTINTNGDFMRYGGNMRLFEAAAVGALQLVDDVPGVHQWFTPGENIVTYSDHDDLRARARYYLEHETERVALAQRAREHVYAHHTYDQRAQRLDELLADMG